MARIAKRDGHPSDLNLPTMTRAIPGEVRAIDLTGNGLADRMYAADMGGQILRFDIHHGLTGPDFVTGGVIAQLGAEGINGVAPLEDTRRFYASPDVSIFTSERLDNGALCRSALVLDIGLTRSTTSTSTAFYSVRDADVFNSLSQVQYDNYPIVTENNLVEVAGQQRS